MNKLSPSRLEAYRKAVHDYPEGCEYSLLDHIDAITAEHNAEANRLSEQCDELTKICIAKDNRIVELEQQMMAMSDDLLNLSNKWRLHDDT